MESIIRGRGVPSERPISRDAPTTLDPGADGAAKAQGNFRQLVFGIDRRLGRPAIGQGRGGVEERRSVGLKRSIGAVNGEKASHLGNNDGNISLRAFKEQPAFQTVKIEEHIADVGLRIIPCAREPFEIRATTAGIDGRVIRPVRHSLPGFVWASRYGKPGVDQAILDAVTCLGWQRAPKIKESSFDRDACNRNFLSGRKPLRVPPDLSPGTGWYSDRRLRRCEADGCEGCRPLRAG